MKVTFIPKIKTNTFYMMAKDDIRLRNTFYHKRLKGTICNNRDKTNFINMCIMYLLTLNMHENVHYYFCLKQ